MARWGRLDDWVDDDDSDETGATVVMDGSVEFDTVPDAVQLSDDDDDEGETVVMKASDAAAMFDDDAVLDEPFQPWVEEEEARVDRFSKFLDPDLHDAVTRQMPAGRAMHAPVASDPQVTLEPRRADDDDWDPTVITLGVAAGLVILALTVATGLAAIALLLL
jgi:hypothetical protein